MPVKEFPDSDWKQLRKVYEAAFSRYCETSLEEARAVIEDASLVPSDRFDALCRKVKGKQKELNSIFYTFNFSHSNALMTDFPHIANTISVNFRNLRNPCRRWPGRRCP